MARGAGAGCAADLRGVEHPGADRSVAGHEGPARGRRYRGDGRICAGNTRDNRVRDRRDTFGKFNVIDIYPVN